MGNHFFYQTRNYFFVLRARKEHGEEVEAMIEDMKERAYEVKVANAQRKIDFREKQQK